MRYVVIMAGGVGTRLWPLSKQGTPKQLLPLIEGKSLLQKAYSRAVALVPAEQILIVTGAAYVAQVAAQLPELSPQNILGEPQGRDSLNAAAWPAAVLQARDPEAVIAQITADQLIDPMKKFVKSFEKAFSLVEADPGVIVTLGVVPTHPHTGFGYIRRGDKISDVKGAFEVAKFVEKPKRKIAEEYLDSGKYWWNAGLFCWKASTFLSQLDKYFPKSYVAVTELAAHPERLDDIFPTLEKTSIDYGLMEPISIDKGEVRVAVVALNVDWRDVGGYGSLADIIDSDVDGNSISGLSVTVDASENIIINDDPNAVIGAVGVSGLVIVRTAKATLVVPVDKAERIKKLVAKLPEKAGTEFV